MIEPDKITNFNRTDKELEQFFVFVWFSKAAKAEQVAAKVNSFFDHLDSAFEDMEMRRGRHSSK